MIPFEDEYSLTGSEKRARQILEANWDYVVRSTSGMRKDLEQRYPDPSELLNRNIREDIRDGEKSIFRAGIPDFFAFDESGDYKFVEVKSGDDGLRHTQLRWLRDFRGINAEIWFAKNKKIEDELDAENVQAYTFKDRKGERSEKTVRRQRDSLVVELPETLASILGLSEDDPVDWRLKSDTELILDSK